MTQISFLHSPAPLPKPLVLIVKICKKMGVLLFYMSHLVLPLNPRNNIIMEIFTPTAPIINK